MDEKIDHGAIIDVRTFDISNEINLGKLYLQTARLCLEQFKQTTEFLLNGIVPSTIDTNWKGRLYKSSELPSEYFEIVELCNDTRLFCEDRKRDIQVSSNISRY